MKENSNKSLILKISVVILLILVLIGVIYLIMNKENKKENIIVYLKDEYKESNLSDIKNLKGVENVSYMSNKDVYKKLKEKIKSEDFSLLFSEKDFDDIIIVEVKHNYNKKITDDINNLGFAKKSISTDNVYEQVLMNLASYAMYLKLDISDEEFDKVYNFAKSIDGVYDVKKVTKDEALNSAKGQLGKDADKVIAEYEKSNPFSASVTFRVSNMNDFDRIENEVKSFIDSMNKNEKEEKDK